jgi:hypothetical protein
MNEYRCQPAASCETESEVRQCLKSQTFQDSPLKHTNERYAT